MVALNELKFNQNFNSRNEHFMVFSNRNDKIGRNKILDRQNTEVRFTNIY